MNTRRVSRVISVLVGSSFIGCWVVSMTAAGSEMASAMSALEIERVEKAGTEQVEKPAEVVYKNIQIFKGLPASRLLGAMNRFTQFLNVNCDHCHVPAKYDKDDKPTKQTARKMFQMVRLIGRELNTNTVTCYTCHRGRPQPEPPPAAWKAEMDEMMKKGVEDTRPAEQVFKNVQALRGVPAGRWTTIMTMFTRALGVECSHCHIPGAFEKDDKPSKLTARKMLALTGSISREIYNGPTPVNCYTCHRGGIKPISMPE